MAEIIKDGTGTGQTLQIDEHNRAHTQSLSVNAALSATLTGDTFDISATELNLTTAMHSGLIYIKNLGDEDLIVDTIDQDALTRACSDFKCSCTEKAY